jgi:hypothetical protein
MMSILYEGLHLLMAVNQTPRLPAASPHLSVSSGIPKICWSGPTVKRVALLRSTSNSRMSEIIPSV